MKSLADKVLALIPDDAAGLSLSETIARLGHDRSHTRAAFDELGKTCRAKLVKRGRGGAIYLLRIDAATLACEVCSAEFVRPPKSKRVTCSRPCHAALRHKRATPEQKAKWARALSAAQSTPEALARTAATNKRRWSKPEEHRKASEQNSKRWKDPEYAAVVAAKIRINHRKPEVRKFYSDFRKALWADPENRKKMHEAAKNSQKTQAYRQKLSRLVKERWKDPAFREKWTAANKARNTPELRAANSKRMKARHAARRAEREGAPA